MKRKKRKLEIPATEIDLLNVDFLRKFMSGEGKAARISSRFLTGLSAQQQRAVTKAIKRARALNLL